MAGAADEGEGKKQPHDAAHDDEPREARPTSPPKMQAYAREPPHYYNSQPTDQQERAHSPSHRDPGAQMALPGIHHFEGQQQMQSRAQYVPINSSHTQHMMHAPPYASNLMGYPPQPMLPTMPSNAPNGQNSLIRYALPPQGVLDSRTMSGGRHKKEIKRRTKTGCMTCRKRRIKCDETQPACRNCAKSKRECLGYDPIFKPSGGPANLKPAPSPILEGPPHDATAAPRYQYPAYMANGSTYATQMPHPEQNQTAHFTYRPPLECSPHIESAAARHSSVVSTALGATSRLLDIRDLYSLDDIPPPQLPREALSPPLGDQKPVTEFFLQNYAPGLDKLFETSWYSSRGAEHLYSESPLRDFVLQCMTRMRVGDSPNTSTRSLEAKLVWELALMPLLKHSTLADAQDAEKRDLEPRIIMLQNLLTGSSSMPERVPPPPQPVSDRASDEEKAEHFWRHLIRFSTLQDSPDDAEQGDIALIAMRHVLNVRENRDVLYSIAVTRHVGARLPTWRPGQPVPPEQVSDAEKLRVAHMFVTQESHSGTTQVVQRICGMALRAWALRQHR